MKKLVECTDALAVILKALLYALVLNFRLGE